jgi:glycogen debranching enzyme
MKVTHFLTPQKKQEKEVDSVGFLLSNNLGDYLWMNESVKSRYEGWFCRVNEKMLRVIETIEVEDGGEVLEVQNFFNHIERKRKNISEVFYLSQNEHNFTYELSEKRSVNIFFDFRESYSSSYTKNYKFKKEGDFLIVEFNPHFFLVVKSEEGSDIKEIVNRNYSYDEKRNSFPYNRDVYSGLSLFGKKFIFAVGESKKEAINEIKKITLKNILKEKNSIDFLCAKNALSNLLITKSKGAYAGLPWFFHFWQRDEAICLKSIISINPDLGKEIFFKLLKNGLKKGPGGVKNVDSVGWAIKRLEDVFPFLNETEKQKAKREIKRILEELLWSFTENNLFINKAHETWMDSIARDGARIELQAMRINMYKALGSLTTKKTEKEFYKKLENEMKNEVRKIFFDGTNLYDGYYPKNKEIDKVVRPNIFIAAYIYPELLSKKDWMICIDNALKKLWLDWGGVSTIDKESKDFCEYHTGENARSYHQGDSWFYLNNLTAIVLYRLDSKKYNHYIKKIIEASKEELLYKGAVGCHGEVSSAGELRSEGCVNQAWSSALYLEAKKEIGL